MSERVTLEFLAAQQRRMLDEIGSLRDDIGVLTAIVLRHEETLRRVLEQITAMVAQNARVVDRVRVLDGRVGQLEEQRQ